MILLYTFLLSFINIFLLFGVCALKISSNISKIEEKGE